MQRAASTVRKDSVCVQQHDEITAACLPGVSASIVGFYLKQRVRRVAS